MQVLDDKNDALPPISQALGSFMSEHTGDREIDGRTLPQLSEEELGTPRFTQKQPERRVASVGGSTPINILPPELLVTVFEIAVEPDSDSILVLCDNATLLLVCQYWNHLVNNTPSLWAMILKTALISNASIRRTLEKSKNAPLEIEYGENPLSPVEDEAEFLDAIFTHAHRWRKATLRIRGDAQKLERMTNLSMPLLESLSLFVYKARGEPLDIFGGRPPARLQELFIHNTIVPWSPTTLCNLRVLEIGAIRHLGPSLDQLYSIISASPSLESLSLRGVAFSGSDSTLPPSRIHIPTLRKLCLRRIETTIITRLLAALHAPKCKFGAFRARVQGDPFETFFTSNISHFFDHMRSGADACTIMCDRSQISISWEGPWCITFDVDDIRIARRVFDWLSISPKPGFPAVPLNMQIREGDDDPPLIEDILTVMADTQAVHRISFDQYTPVAGALRILSAGSLVGGAREPFPGLKEILIAGLMGDDEWEHLLRTLRRRQGGGEAMNGDQHLKPLRKVVFGGVWRSYDHDKEIAEFRSIHWPNRLEEVRRLLGPEGELIWYTRPVTEDGVLAAYKD